MAGRQATQPSRKVHGRLRALAAHGLAVLVLALAGTHADAARLALVIGNDQYSHIKPLKNARNDARLMADTLRAAGFEVVGQVRQNLNRAEMWRAVNQFKARISKNDEVVFYFSGHGVQIGANQMLLPVDIDADSADQIDTDALRLLDVQDRFREAGFALLVIDACRDNPFPPKPGLRSIGSTRGLVPPARDQVAVGTAIFMAASSGQRALDSVPGSSTAHGLFTWELVQSLKTPGLDVVTALRQTRDRVEDKARRAQHDQRPALAEEMRGQFVLFPGAAAAAPAAVAQVSLEDEAWALCRSAATPGPCQAYLEDYPQGRYARLARVRMADLAPRTAPTATGGSEPSTRVAARSGSLGDGDLFKDCETCPDMVVIPAGGFDMGSRDGDLQERPVRRVNLGRFAMARTEVTVAQYLACVADKGCAEPEWREAGNPSHHQTGSDAKYRRLGAALTGADFPIVGVSWQDAQRYVAWLSGKAGVTYRLPSEAEWEYAARARSDEAWSFGSNGSKLADHAWFRANSRDSPQRVAGKLPNAFGLYDMHGNVREWVQDTWHPDYMDAPTDGSAWTDGGQPRYRVIRSGGWFDNDVYTRSAIRINNTPDYRIIDTGFRVARAL